MVRNFLKVICILTACNVITADTLTANNNQYNKASFSSLLKGHPSLFTLLGILGCGIAYKLFTQVSAQDRTEQLKREHEQGIRFERQRQQRQAEKKEALRKKQKTEDEIEEETIKKQQEWERLIAEIVEQEELRRQGLPIYLTGGLRDLYRECGIPAQRTPFDVLGVGNNAPEEEVKAAFRRETFRWHPDKNRDNPKAKARFQLVNECYQRCIKIQESPELYRF